MTRVYKILPEADWLQALAAGVYRGSAVDHVDGFIHLSTAAQATETARRHFHGQEGLVVLAIEAGALGEALVWEPSRGGDVFPHLYGVLPTPLVLEVRTAPLDGDGVPSVRLLSR